MNADKKERKKKEMTTVMIRTMQMLFTVNLEKLLQWHDIQIRMVIELNMAP